MKYRIYYGDDVLISRTDFAPDDHRGATNIYDLDGKWIAQFKSKDSKLLSQTSTANSKGDYLQFDMIPTGQTAYLGGVLGNVYVSEGVSMSEMETCGVDCWPRFVGVVVHQQDIQYTMMFYDIEPEELNKQPYADFLKAIEFIKSE